MIYVKVDYNGISSGTYRAVYLTTDWQIEENDKLHHEEIKRFDSGDFDRDLEKAKEWIEENTNQPICRGASLDHFQAER